MMKPPRLPRIARLLLPATLALPLIAATPVDAPLRQTAKGAYVFGSATAPVKLVEYGSYTCSHCAAFSQESAPVLKGRMIPSGKVSLEYRHLIRDPADLGAAILARCAGPRGFGAAHAMIFATQDTWLPKLGAYQQAHPTIDQSPMLVQARAYVDAGGLTAAMRARGLSTAKINGCFADKAEVARITAMTGDAPIEVRGTPTFFLNGELQSVTTWDKLEPVLRAAGAR